MTKETYVHISHVEQFPHMTDSFSTFLHMTDFSPFLPSGDISPTESLHMTDLFSIGTACGACDKCQVWICLGSRYDLGSTLDLILSWIYPCSTNGCIGHYLYFKCLMSSRYYRGSTLEVDNYLGSTLEVDLHRIYLWKRYHLRRIDLGSRNKRYKLWSILEVDINYDLPWK